MVRASELLAKLTGEAVAQAREGAELKRFRFSASGRNVRSMDGRLDEYMSLPVEAYALYDPELMSRVGDDVFELRLPLVGPTGTAVRPMLRVRVAPEGKNSLRIDSIGGSLFEPPNATEAAEAEREIGGLERGLREASLGFNTTLCWKRLRPGWAWEAERGGPGATRLTSHVNVALEVPLPPPFSRVPAFLLQGAVSIVMRTVIELVLPQFVALLERDYVRWSDGSRDLAQPVGTLLPEGTRLLSDTEGAPDRTGALVVDVVAPEAGAEVEDEHEGESQSELAGWRRA